MKKIFGKNKKGFTLMEVVIALAVVGLICSLILPLTASAINSFNAAQQMRNVANAATKKMATTKYGDSGKDKVTLYITVTFPTLGVKSESKFKFSGSTEKESTYGSQVTYYELEQINVKGIGETK